MTCGVTTHKDLLTALLTLKPKYRVALLKTCDEKVIHCICECIFNVLQGKVSLDDRDKKKLHKHKNILRKLVSKGKNKQRKKIIIQKGGAFLPIILGSILSGVLNSFIS